MLHVAANGKTNFHKWVHESSKGAEAITFRTHSWFICDRRRAGQPVTNSSFQNYTHTDDHTKQTTDKVSK